MFFNLFKCFKIQKKQEITERKEDDLEKECTICMGDIESDNFITKCHHQFHKKCLNEWISLYSNTECPICRNELGLYVFESKKERKQRLRKEEHLKQIKKEEEELERLAEIRRREQEDLEENREKYKRNKKRVKFFKNILNSLNIEYNHRYKLNNVDFLDCVSIRKFVRQYINDDEEVITGQCYFCNKNTYSSFRLNSSQTKIFHKQCYKIHRCYKHHHHNYNIHH